MVCPDPEAPRDPPDSRDLRDFPVHVARLENQDLADPQVHGGSQDHPVKTETTEKKVYQENRDPRDKQESPEMQGVQVCLECLE